MAKACAPAGHGIGICNTAVHQQAPRHRPLLLPYRFFSSSSSLQFLFLASILLRVAINLTACYVPGFPVPTKQKQIRPISHPGLVVSNPEADTHQSIH
jgi:hypothetical protein